MDLRRLSPVYRCEVCGLTVPPGTPCRRLFVETRPKVYPRRPKAHRLVRWEWERGKWKRKVVPVDDPGGRGVEIVREVVACPRCASRHGGPAIGAPTTPRRPAISQA